MEVLGSLAKSIVGWNVSNSTQGSRPEGYPAGPLSTARSRKWPDRGPRLGPEGWGSELTIVWPLMERPVGWGPPAECTFGGQRCIWLTACDLKPVWLQAVP
jgi:hypothetical protein